MTLQDAHEKGKQGDRLRHAEYQIVIPRLDGFMDTLFQMTKGEFTRTNDDGWTILPPKPKAIAVSGAVKA